MKRSTKIWLLAAAALVVLGILAFVCVMAVNHWDFGKFSNTQYETETVEINEKFEDISVRTDTEELFFRPSEDGKCRVVFYGDKNKTHSAAVQNGTLTIETVDTKKWHEQTLFAVGVQKVTVYLPQAQYAALTVEEDTGNIAIARDFAFETVDISVSTGNIECLASCAGRLRIGTSTGDIRLEGLTAGALELAVTTGEVDVRSVDCAGDFGLTVSTGKTYLENVTCRSFASVGSTGRLTMENVIVTEALSVERSTGDVTLEQCDASELVITTSTGDVTGTLLSEKVFLTQTDTGKVEVPESISGGKCKIATDTGDIILSVR